MAASTKTCKKTQPSGDNNNSVDMARIREGCVKYPLVATNDHPISCVKKKLMMQSRKKPSLRPTENFNEDNNTLQTTTDVRATFAEKLTAILDRTISTTECSPSDVQVYESAVDESVFRLFSTSIPGEVKQEPVTKRRHLSSSSSDSSDDERFESCAVSGDFILEQSRLPIISTGAPSTSAESNQIEQNDAKCNQTAEKGKKKKKRKKLRDDCNNDTGDDDDDIEKGNIVKHKIKKKKLEKESC